MSRLERIRDYVEIAVASVISLLFGASFGWNYGVDNQVVYMLSSLKLVNSGILAKDWFATATTHYHPAFKYLAAALMAISPQGYAVGLMQTLVIGTGMTALYFLIRELGVRRHALPAFLLLVAIACVTRTKGPNATYVFDWILQPSTLGGAAFFVSLPFFVRGKWLPSGIALAVSGLFHANYLILFFGAYTLAHLLLGTKDLKERALKQLLPPFIVLLLFAPMILATAGSKDAKAAQEIYTTVRAPHHFMIGSHERDYLALVGWTLLGLGASGPLARNPKSPPARLGALLCAISAIVWTGICLSVVLQMRQATQLFAWRIVPHTELVFTALACASAARVILDPAAGRRYSPTQLGLLIAGIGALSLWSTFQNKKSLAAIAVAVALVVAIARIAYELGRRFASERVRTGAGSVWARGGAVFVALTCAALVVGRGLLPELEDFRSRSTVFRGLGRHELDLYAWMQANTPADAVFLSPPDHENIRFHGRRAIVVDWKSNPIVPGEVLEWTRRLEDVIGRRLRGHKDLEGYATLDEERVQRLREKYGFDYVIVRRGGERSLGKFKTVYSNNAFTVLDVRG
ncbi:DUF6798 domain-containing protein [Polyangium aurulentum]|uniref:DUF6798 domain-containing protein n=1 Tax=Polyangium aurulentum TaxID=2567896 RepID=UPI0010AE1D56|nr:DUF6798 domain-containing protein [Polyangium aurulentum]UQA60252.1 hypothetical protein E8A73_007175 [Polyangium aurulentum]